MVSQWASTLNAEKAYTEIYELKGKHMWLKCPESIEFITKMAQDLPKILNIIKLQEKQNTILRHENQKLNDYIRVNRMADELILDEIRDKYQIDI